MKIPYELWIGLRYSGITKLFCKLNKKKNDHQDNFISFISVVSILGIALGVSALIVVLSVMNGFQKEIQERIFSTISHVEVYIPEATKKIQQIDHWKEISKAAERNKSVQASAPFLYAQAILMHKEHLQGIQVRGIDPEFEQGVSEICKYVFKGELNNLKPGNSGIIIGQELAKNLKVDLGDNLVLITSQDSSFGLNPKISQLKIVGIFLSGHYEYDSVLGFINIQDAVNIFRSNGILGVRLSLENIQTSRKVISELESVLPKNVAIKDWSQNNQAWFSAIKTEKRIMFLLLFFIVAVASFSLLSSLVMTVKDKQADIAILRTIGSGAINIGYIFLFQGTIIGLIGTILGILSGLALTCNLNSVVSFIEIILQTELVPIEVYSFSKLPADLHTSDVITVSITSLTLSFLATIYPSWRASKLQPIQLLRYD